MKILLPLLFVQPVVYMDFKLTVMRCYLSNPYFSVTDQSAHVHLIHHRHGARSVDLELAETHYAMLHRKFNRTELTKIVEDIRAQKLRMMKAGFVLNQTRLVPDCLFILWPAHGRSVQRAFARRWYYEVAHHSMREQTNFNWVASMFPALNKSFHSRAYLKVGTRPCTCQPWNTRESAGPGGACFDRATIRMVPRLGIADTPGYQWDPPSGCPSASGGPQSSAYLSNLSASECCAQQQAGTLCQLPMTPYHHVPDQDADYQE